MPPGLFDYLASRGEGASPPPPPDIRGSSEVGRVINVGGDKPLSIGFVPVMLKEEVGENVERLGVLVAEDRGRLYLLLVRDVTYASPMARPEVVKAQELLRREAPAPDEIMTPLSAYTAAITEVLDVVEVKDGRIRVLGPIRPPRPGVPVYVPGRDIARVLVGDAEIPLRIGVLANNPEAEVAIDLQALSRHMAIFGTTGTGKSWLRGLLLEQIYDYGIPQVVYDPLRDYVEATKQLGGSVLRYGHNFLPDIMELPSELFEALAAGTLTPLQAAIVRKGFEICLEKGVSNPRELPGCVQKAADALRTHHETKLIAVTRTQALLKSLGFYRSNVNELMLDGDKLAQILNDRLLVTFDLMGLSDIHLQATVATTLHQILLLRIRNKVEPLIVSFDEAHRVAPRIRSDQRPPPALEVVRNLVRYGRHFGIGLITITQFPNRLDEEIVRLPAIKVIFALEPEQAREIRGLLRDLPEELKDALPRLEKGTALLTGTADVVRRSVYVRVSSERRTKHGGETPKFVVKKYGGIQKPDH